MLIKLKRNLLRLFLHQNTPFKLLEEKHNIKKIFLNHPSEHAPKNVPTCVRMHQRTVSTTHFGHLAILRALLCLIFAFFVLECYSTCCEFWTPFFWVPTMQSNSYPKLLKQNLRKITQQRSYLQTKQYIAHCLCFPHWLFTFLYFIGYDV